jgi:isopentenyl phosphate kinase
MLVFLKLGGSLITDKEKPYTPRPAILADLAAQIAAALQHNPDLRIILGHGSGSFGHQAASQYGTRQGVTGPAAWRGFAEVWYQAATLNRIVVEALRAAGLAIVALAPIASVIAEDGRVRAWNLGALRAALDNGLLPVVYGDVIFDRRRGGTILSTEDLFAHLAPRLRPRRILLAGREAGVWADYPARTRLLTEITPQTFAAQAEGLGKAAGADVTGGMESKVRQMMDLVRRLPGLEVSIFSGETSENVRKALGGENPGTLLHR